MEIQKHHLAAIITKIAHEVLEISDSQHFSDWKEDIKTLCAKRHIAYDASAVGSALESALHQRKLVADKLWPATRKPA